MKQSFTQFALKNAVEKTGMLHVIRKSCWLLVLLGFAGSAPAFSLLGPGEDWQSPEIGFNPQPGDAPWLRADGLDTGPKIIGNEYRRVTPIMYYSFDQGFLDFFGSNGIAAVEQAFTVLNNLANVSAYSADLSEFPTQTRFVNFQAESLALLDLKSSTMSLLLEQLGLAEPTRYTWILRDRDEDDCPQGNRYLVQQRNIGITPSPLNELQYSSYVNGTLYSYFIYEDCGDDPPIAPEVDADAVEFPVDPFADSSTAVADFRFSRGQFYNGLTRDDVAGLRYLLRTNNVNFENSGPGSEQFVTNNTPTLITTLDLNLFLQQARTNDAAALIALYPGLVITSTSNSFGRVVTTNISFVFTPPPPTAPAGTPPRLVTVTTFTTNFAIRFHHTFANIITNQISSGGFVFIQNIFLTNSPFAPAGTPPVLVTNTQVRFDLGITSGDFFILPPGLCDVSLISDPEFPNGLPIVTTITTTTTATNAVGVTNATFFQQVRTTFVTNHTLVYFPVECVPDTVGLRQGIEKIRFIRRDFDSLLGRFFEPVTNFYTLVTLTNSTLQNQRMRRVVTAPDFLFTTADLTEDVDNIGAFSRNINFNAANALPGQDGPGTIEPATTIAFNRSTPVYFNASPILTNAPVFFLDELSQITLLAWGSFDGTTNLPVIYPNGTSITNLENMYLTPIIETGLPVGSVGNDYDAQLTAEGGQAPYIWSLVAGSLPPGLSLASNGEISGTPTSPGIYVFTVQLVDSAARSASAAVTLTIF